MFIFELYNTLFKSMKAILIFSVFLFSAQNALYCQPYAVGSRQITFNDPARSRNIATRVYHPATTAGSNQPFVTGSFPLIILGHGFSMSYDAYLNFADSLVPLGYIVVMPTTEVGPIPFPSHEAFGLDLRFLNSDIKAQNNSSTSVFYQHVSPESAIMGHSMGGGCSFLACQNNSDVTTLVSFAPAETDVSAITAATGVTIPALVFSGENDGVAPPADNHIPMYNNLASSCKTFVNILGGGHCYYALSNWACDFGESTSSPQPTITRTQQQQIVFNLLIPYLNYTLKNDIAAGNTFLYRLQNNTAITFQRDCLTAIGSENIKENYLFPNPAEDVVYISDKFIPPFSVTIYNTCGKMIMRSEENSQSFDISGIKHGVYYINISDPDNTVILRFIKM